MVTFLMLPNLPEFEPTDGLANVYQILLVLLLDTVLSTYMLLCVILSATLIFSHFEAEEAEIQTHNWEAVNGIQTQVVQLQSMGCRS